jgi:hypothetical protein
VSARPPHTGVVATGAERRWRIDDVIDFEDFARRAAHDDDAGDAERAAAAVPSDDRRVVLLAWLDARRGEGGGPGTTYRRARRVVAALAVLSGFMLGFGLVGALLSKSDSEPINAPLFFGATVGVQLAAFVGVLLAWTFGRDGGRFGPLREALAAVLAFVSRLVDRLPGERRSALRARRAAIELGSARLAPLVGCDLVVVTQTFAIAFNVGLLAALLCVWLPFTDLRFGWQSSYSFTASGIAVWVRLVALPWSWIGAVLGPTADAIAATQYARGQAAATLPVDAARAWWPFLALSIAVYGLALRALVAIAAAFALRRRLGRLAFASPDANLVWRRIRGALIVADEPGRRLPDGAIAPTAATGRVDLVFVDVELASEQATLRDRIDVAARVVVTEVDDDAPSAGVDATTRVVVAVAATRDPIVAIAGFLRTLSARTPDVIVLLVGDEDDGRLTIWRRFVAIERLAVGVDRLR